MVKLSFKTPSKDKPFDLEIDLGLVITVEHLKQKVGEQTNSTVPNIKLIHKGRFFYYIGKILKDETPLETLKLVDGETFHVVIKVIEA
jgi:hypothetical protein